MMSDDERAAANYVARTVFDNWENDNGDYVDFSVFLTASIARAVRKVKEAHKCTD
jgi:hypothetical protein